MHTPSGAHMKHIKTYQLNFLYMYSIALLVELKFLRISSQSLH